MRAASQTVAYAAGGFPESVAIGDLDGVNGPDLAVANRLSDDVSVLLNQGDGDLLLCTGPFSLGGLPLRADRRLRNGTA